MKELTPEERAEIFDKEKHRAQARAYYHANKEKCKQNTRDWVAKNQERVRAYQRDYQRQYRENYRKELNAKNRAWRAEKKAQRVNEAEGPSAAAGPAERTSNVACNI